MAKNKPTKEQILVLAHIHVSIGLAIAGSLANLYHRPMILQRYRQKIIANHINAVQHLYITSKSLAHAIYVVDLGVYLSQPTAPKSYLPTALKSYLSTAPKSYLTKWVSNFLTNRFSVVLLLPLIMLATSSDSNASLSEFADSSDEQSNSNNKSTNTFELIDDLAKAAYGYTRQSQSSPDDSSSETMSIEVQKQHIHEIADELGYEIANIFVDMDESGYTFDREGFKKLDEHLEQDPRPVVLDRINRLGRNTLETIYVAAVIHYEHEVEIITYRNGLYNLDSTSDQITLVVEAITAGKSVEDRIRAAWDTIKRKFEKEKVWSTWFDNVRLGYRLPDDKDWPEPVTGGEKVVSAIMEDVIETENYSQVAKLIKSHVNNEGLDQGYEQKYSVLKLPVEDVVSVFDYSDIDIDDTDGAIIKRIVEDPIYVGRVVYPRSADESEQAVKEDSELQLISEDLFEEVNETVDDIAKKHSTTTDSVDIEKLADMGLIMKVLEDIDRIKPICDHCGRGMEKNGSETLKDGSKCHYWICPEYDTDGGEKEHDQMKFPHEKEWEMLKNHAENENSDVVILRIKPFNQ
ncbi:recombinase family protein [Halonotius aquaticus]|nr:recombinase family protein [Halonotius aquaticus]